MHKRKGNCLPAGPKWRNWSLTPEFKHYRVFCQENMEMWSLLHWVARETDALASSRFAECRLVCPFPVRAISFSSLCIQDSKDRSRQPPTASLSPASFLPLLHWLGSPLLTFYLHLLELVGVKQTNGVNCKISWGILYVCPFLYFLCLGSHYSYLFCSSGFLNSLLQFSF